MKVDQFPPAVAKLNLKLKENKSKKGPHSPVRLRNLILNLLDPDKYA